MNDPKEIITILRLNQEKSDEALSTYLYLENTYKYFRAIDGEDGKGTSNEADHFKRKRLNADRLKLADMIQTIEEWAKLRLNYIQLDAPSFVITPEVYIGAKYELLEASKALTDALNKYDQFLNQKGHLKPKSPKNELRDNLLRLAKHANDGKLKHHPAVNFTKRAYSAITGGSLTDSDIKGRITEINKE